MKVVAVAAIQIGTMVEGIIEDNYYNYITETLNLDYNMKLLLYFMLFCCKII